MAEYYPPDLEDDPSDPSPEFWAPLKDFIDGGADILEEAYHPTHWLCLPAPPAVTPISDSAP